jgi:hypothetical protein
VSDWQKLDDQLPERWRGAGLKISEEGLQFRTAVLAAVPSTGDVRRVPLLGDALSLLFTRSGGDWTLALEGPLQKALADVELAAGTDGAAEFRFPAGRIQLLNGRLEIVPAAGLEAVVVVTATASALELRNSSDAEARVDVRLDPVATSLDAEGVAIQLQLPFPRVIGIAIGIPAQGALPIARVGAGTDAVAAVLETLAGGTVTLIPAELFGQVPPLMTGGGAGGLVAGGARIAGTVKAIAENGRLRLNEVELTIPVSATMRAQLTGWLELNSRLQADSAKPLGQFRVVSRDFAFLAGSRNPFTLVVFQESVFDLHVTDTGWNLSAAPAAGRTAAASVVVPGIEEADVPRVRPAAGVEEDPVRSRFVLDLRTGDGAPALSFGTDGVALHGVARDRPVAIPGLTDARVTGGTITAAHGDWQLRLAAEANLPWFRGARGRIAVEGARTADGFRFGATFGITVSTGWTDPSGVVTIRNPTVSATLRWEPEPARWAFDGSVGGSFVFNRVLFAGDAASWLGELFDGISVEFDRIPLTRLGSLGDAFFRVALKQPLRVPLWDIFNFEIRRIGIRKAAGLSFDGDVGFSFGEVRFLGSIPELRVTLDGGRVGLDVSALPSFRGFLTAPSGIRVRMAFTREAGETAEILSGTGNLTGPTIPDVAVMVRVGRFRKAAEREWRPTVGIFASVPVNAPVFPGIVAKRVGVGFGIHQTLRGLDEMGSVADAYQLIRSGALPQPGQAESWQVDEETAFSLVAQSLLAATTAKHDVPDYYVADVVVSLDTRLRLAGFGRLWMFTSPADALTPEFQERPYARGVLLMDAAEPSLVAAYESEPQPRMSVERGLGPGSAVVGSLLGAVRTRASLEARPGLFDLTLGPNDLAFSLGPFHATGQTLLGIRATSAGVHVVAAASLSARVEAQAGLGIGPAKVAVRASAGFSARATLYGGLVDRQLLVAAELSVSAYARLGVHVEIGFSIRIRVGWVKVTIRWSKHWDFDFDLQVEVGATLALGSTGAAFQGRARVEFRVVGIGVSATLPVSAGDPDLLGRATGAMQRAKQGHLLPSKAGATT